ncbi:MAG: hypothetical protein JST90_12545 [Bacteroidetes bacterium]|nr:hypothetical protein [Bacteroidota bacterium]
MNILKRIVAIATGIAVGLGFVMVGDYLSTLVHPWPHDLDYHNREVIINYMNQLPLLAFLAMIGGYAAGAFLGGIVATLLSGRQAVRPAMIVGIVLTMGNIFNQMQIPHPLWFAVVAIGMSIPLAWSGWRVVRTEEAPVA